MESILIQYIDDWSFADLVEQTSKGEDFNIFLDSYGGDLQAGWKMYDLLKNYEGNVVVNVVGACMSAANLILLGVDKQHRVCNEHAQFLIHKPLLDWFGALTQKDIKEIDKMIDIEQKRLMDLYHAELTANDAILNALVDNEQVFGATQAKAYGFVGQVNVRKTDDKVKNMVNAVLKMKNKVQKPKIDMDNKTLINKLITLLKNEKELTVTDADGNEVKVTAAGDTPAVGDGVDAPDGALLMADGSTWVIEGGVIKSIEPAAAPATDDPAPANDGNEGDEDKDKEIEDLKAQIKALEEEKAGAEEEKKKADEEKEELKNEVAKLKQVTDVINELGGVEALKNLVSSKPSVKNAYAKDPADMTKDEKRAIVFGK